MRAFVCKAAVGLVLNVVILALAGEHAAAQMIGAGVGIPLEVVDTPGGGPRTNVDQSYTVTLGPGIYYIEDWEYAAGQSGSVTPFLSTLAGADSYNVIALGNTVNIPGTQTATTNFGFSNTFVLTAPTTLYAGFNNPSPSQNPIFLDNATATLTDHDGSPSNVTAIGQNVTGFSNPNLGRTYAFGLNLGTRAATRVGADIGIPHEALDTANSGPRMNIDLGHTTTLGPGVYQATDFTFSAGQDGSVTPFLAIFDGVDYELIALGNTVTVPDGNTNQTVEFGGSSTFTLLDTTQIFAGITNPAGSDNPIFLDNGTATQTDHDSSPVMLTALGQMFARSGFSNQGLGRTYAFSIGIEQIAAVPEPSTITIWLSLGLLGAGVAWRRGRGAMQR